MKPQMLRVAHDPAQSFSVRQEYGPFLDNRLHYHREIELVLLENGSGTQFIGDSATRFTDGGIILLGSRLPHSLSFDRPDLTIRNQAAPALITAHFDADFWGHRFLDLPENLSIKKLFEKCKRGIILYGATRKCVAGLMREMLTAEPFYRLKLLLEALHHISISDELQVVSSHSFIQRNSLSDEVRVDAIYQYTLSNLTKGISLEEISAVACVSPNSFCRYFKTHTGKTFSMFLLECKVSQACRLLIQNHLPLKQICYESGFNNTAGFHKYFKKITSKTPLEYQRNYKQP